MKTNILRLLAAAALVLVCTWSSRADTVDFLVSAQVPAATGVSIVATQVDSASNTFGNAVNALSFSPLTYNATNGIYLPDHYFAIDVGATGGAGSPDVTVSYAEGTKPANQGNGLGYKSVATFVKITGPDNNQVESNLVTHGPKKLLKDLTGENITQTELQGGFLRVYVGVYPGDDVNINNAGGEVFSNADQPGNYDGTLTVTATVS